MNKQRERATVESFVAFSGIVGLSLDDCDRERPDALVRRGNELIGVEVTMISEAIPRQVTAPQRWSAEASRIVREAQQLFESRHPITLVVRFHMHPAWRPSDRANARMLVNDLATLVEQAIAEPPPFIQPGEPVTLAEPHPAVCWVYVGLIRKEFGSDWTSSFANEVWPASEADIRATVARKDPEAEVYRTVAPAVWLLIDCDLNGQGVSLDVPKPDFTVTCAFDRVFCCGFPMSRWIEIPTRPGGHSMTAG